ncbi:glycosyltransferase family 4 protein [Iamia sp. SCSIO 61187]|uniref:MraY family glycosyltransferase n=1 Tax=Iamia sp. SCSIO 61187 TaxID=2722752 RepID=UPI001C63340D|nr:glycosyltransferase family 4 protein [Iamia sp. SCSIO 61187]QYG92355.1 glycosyltransferase family 4 protein [Iamia sp. SCSIO 61187]
MDARQNASPTLFSDPNVAFMVQARSAVNVAAAVTALLVCIASAPGVIRWLERRAVLDVPVARSSHAVPTLRGGGISPAVGCLSATALLVLLGTGAPVVAVAAVASAFGLVGLADDLYNVPARSRLAAQVAIALLASGAAVLITEPGGTLLGLLIVGIGAIWLVGYVNGFNFMDGINGISSVQALVAGLSWVAVGRWEDEPAVTAAGVVVAAGAAGFLPFNFPRARMFLGDVGSYFLGAWLAMSALIGVSLGISPVAMGAPLALYLADTSITLARRALRREPLTEAHRSHAYQRLVVHGWSHARVTVTVGAVIGACSLVGLAAVGRDWLGQLVGGAMIAAMAGAFIFLPTVLRGSQVPSRPTSHEGQ